MLFIILFQLMGMGVVVHSGSHYVDYGRASSAQTCTKAGYAFSGFSITKGSVVVHLIY